MNKKDSLDKLLYQYAEKPLNDMYDTLVDKYENDEEFNNLEMNIVVF